MTWRVLAAYLDTSALPAEKQAYLLVFRDGCKAINVSLQADEVRRFERAIRQAEGYLANGVRAGHPGLALFASGGEDYFFAMPSKLLVPLDGSILGESAVPWATCLARTAGHSIVLAQAVPWPLIATEGLIGAYASPEMCDDILRAECDEATSYLNRIRDGLVDQGLQIEVVVRPGAPMTAVLDIADETKSDLIVMATRGRGGVPRAPGKRRQLSCPARHNPDSAGTG